MRSVTRIYIKSAAISTAIISILLIYLIPKVYTERLYYIDQYKVEPSSILFFLKIMSLIPLLLIVLYRIYFSSNWYIYIEYINDDSCIKSMMIEVMEMQRGYRMVYYGVIHIISSFIFLCSYYFEYNYFKHNLSGKYAIGEIFNKEKVNAIIIGIILLVYLIESLYLKELISMILKNWFNIDYGMGERTKAEQIFFWRFKCNFIIIISYSLIFGGMFLSYKFNNKLHLY